MESSPLIERVRRLLSTYIGEYAGPAVEVVACSIVPRQLAMIAVRSADALPDPVRVSVESECRTCLGVKKVVFVEWDPSPERFITNAFSHVDVRRIAIIQTALATSGHLAKVVVAEPQLETALGPESVFPRAAAMLTQMDIEVVLPGEVDEN